MRAGRVGGCRWSASKGWEVTEVDRECVCEAVHSLLERLPALNGKPSAAVPSDGIYFWYEKGETRHGHGARVSRVGTHKRYGRLRARIREHFGSNREGSAFRRHVGAALMARDGMPEQDIREWGRGRRSDRFDDEEFGEYELRVTQQAYNGVYRVLRVDDTLERLGLEENLVALFSLCQHCVPPQIGSVAGRLVRRFGGPGFGMWSTSAHRTS